MVLRATGRRRSKEGHLFDWTLEDGGFCVLCGIQATVKTADDRTYTLHDGTVIGHPPPECPGQRTASKPGYPLKSPKKRRKSRLKAGSSKAR